MQRLDLPENIDTTRLTMRRLRYEESEEIFYTYASKPEATKFLSWKTHNSIDDTRTFIRYALQSWAAGTDYIFSIRIRQTGKLIGSFGVVNEQGKIQFGYVLSPSHWGNGYATEACKAILALVRQLPVYRIGTFVDADNDASIRVLEKCGLVQEARLEKWFRFANQNNEPKDCLLFKLPLTQ